MQETFAWMGQVRPMSEFVTYNQLWCIGQVFEKVPLAGLEPGRRQGEISSQKKLSSDEKNSSINWSESGNPNGS